MSRKSPISTPAKPSNPKRITKDPSDTREGLLLLARLAAAGNRYEHMFQYTKRLVGIVAPGKTLTAGERECFFSASAFLLHGQLNSFRYVSKELTDSAVADKMRAGAAVDYLQMLASEICETVADVIGIIDLCLLGNRRSAAAMMPPESMEDFRESRGYFKMMKGDFFKGLAEVKKGAGRERVLMDAFRAYESASHGLEKLEATHPTRLESKLSLAIFYSEIRFWPTIAYNVASEAYDLAMQEIATSGQIAREETAEVLKRLQSFMNKLKK